jgi:large subunit ribosomal protein L21
MIRIEKLSAVKGKEFKEGDKVVFDKVLLVDDGSATTVGTPHISGAAVSGTIAKIARAPKVTVIHYKQKSRYFKKAGHRQPYFAVKIDALK